MHSAKKRIAIIVVLISFTVISSCVPDPGNGESLVLTIGSASASRGTEDAAIHVSLSNSMRLRGIQMDICDEGNYLTCTRCEPELRASDFECATYELSNGCARIFLYSIEGNCIDEGTGSLFSIYYNIADDAPFRCINLTPEGIKIADENKKALTPVVKQGKFCIR